MAADPIRVAVVGTGFGNRVQVPALMLNPETRVTWICSHSLERARAVAQEHRIAHATDDYREAIAGADVDLVTIVTPPHLHAPIALAALRAGKHVLCEKPFVLNIRQARRLVAEARRRRCLGFINHEFRYIAARARLKELVLDGWLGAINRIALVEATPWMSPSSTLTYGWQSQAEYGGGVLGALGSHAIDFCRWVAGDIREVTAWLSTVVRRRKRKEGGTGVVDADDNVSLRLRVPDNVIATIEICATAGTLDSHLYVYGQRGALHIENGKLFGLRAGREPTPVIAPPPVRRKLPEGAHPLLVPFYALVSEVVKRIRGEQSTAPTFEDGLRVQEVLDAARRSSRTRCGVNLGRAEKAAK